MISNDHRRGNTDIFSDFSPQGSQFSPEFEEFPARGRECSGTLNIPATLSFDSVLR
jgi:hypothetical protein